MTLRGKKIAVTGASGFLGRYIVKALLARDAQVIAVVRNPDKVPLLRDDPRIEVRSADLADRSALTHAFRGADGLISNAALFSVGNTNWKQHFETNIEGTENVLRAAAAAELGRVVHVSSVAVYRKMWGRSMDEHSPQHEFQQNPSRVKVYPMSKAVSEQRAWLLAKELHLKLTCIRPSMIFGAFDPNMMPIFKKLWGRRIGILPRGLTLPLVYAGDVALAITASLENERSIGESYNTAGGNGSFADFFKAWKAAGEPSAPIIVPFPVPLRFGFNSEKAAKDLGFRNRSFFGALQETFQLERDPSTL